MAHITEAIASPVDEERDAELLDALAQPVTDLMSRHMERTKSWHPHKIVPYELGRNFNDEPWQEDQYPMPQGVRSAIFVNLLTEDNLPWYTEMLAGMSERTHPMRKWVGRWTAEENRHSITMRDWVHVTRAFDPELLEDGRMEQVEGAEVPRMATVSEMLAYTSLQELATGVAHRNVGTELTRIDRLEGQKRQGGVVMARLAGDEAHHHKFYADVAKAGLAVDPSTMLIAIAHQLRYFKMPGTGIPDFDKHEKAISDDGIYDARAFYQEVVTPTLNYWEIDNIREEDLSPEAQKARQAIHRRTKSLARVAIA